MTDMNSQRERFEQILRQVVAPDYIDDVLSTEGDGYAEYGTVLAWDVFQAAEKLSTEKVDNPVESETSSTVPSVHVRDIKGLDEVKPFVDAWIRQRGTSVDGQSYVAALQLAAYVKAALAAAPTVDAPSERETVPKWVFDGMTKTLEPAWNYIQTHQEQFGAMAGDDKTKIIVDEFLKHFASESVAIGALDERERDGSGCPHPVSHKWDEDGERCEKCGDKDWMADQSCSERLLRAASATASDKEDQ
ncbi:hypothetical protein [Paraburkholderia sp. XV]|uniref:hypothetical protein n=1 Tax=Paraburkholderia sp. XV TaxID=2831520 RepID=UPI001CD50842|nr:hypothetical protein [Paraburkholderia sp. XV]